MTDSLRRLAMLVTVSVVAGLVVAAMLVPLVAGIGTVSNDAAGTWESQQCTLAEQPALPQRTHIVAADGSTIANFYYQNRVAITFDQIPIVMREAIVAIEDSRFYDHNGVDVQGMMRAALRNGQAGSVEQGGSTLTQQYVKNMFLLAAKSDAERKAAVADTVARKLREARCALDLEQHMSKQQILAGYLNIALFGPGIYGIEAASEHYFGVSARKLTLPQAALLAGLVKNPSGYDPVRHPQAALDRRGLVLQRMNEVGFITEAQRVQAGSKPLGLHVRHIGNGCETSNAPYFCEWVVDQVQADPAFGPTVQARTNALLRGGLTIHTTLDWRVQDQAQQAVNHYVPVGHKVNPRGIASAVVVVQPGTGAVKAMAVNLPFGNGNGQNANNLATGGSLGFQAGSTFKMFTLITALEQHVPINYRINSPHTYCSKVTPSYSCTPPLHGVSNAGDSESGDFTLLQATADSVNTYFVQLIEKIGVLPVRRTAESMGIDFTLFNKTAPGPPDASLTLGTWGVSPLEMAEAYATLAARGKHCPAFGITGVVQPDGSTLSLPAHPCEQVIPQGIADTATQILTHVIDGPGSHTGGNASIGRPAAGKTGTTDSYGAAWFDGFTPQLAAAVWMGDPAGPRPGLRGFTLNGTYWTHQFGGDLPARMWAATMKGALTALKLPPVDFPKADPLVEYGDQVQVPVLTGLKPADALKRLSAVGLAGTVAATPVGSAVPAGLVAETSPAAGTSLAPGTEVVVYLSNGVAPPPPSPTATPTGQPGPGPTGSPLPPPTTQPTPSPGPIPIPIPTPPAPPGHAKPTGPPGHH